MLFCAVEAREGLFAIFHRVLDTSYGGGVGGAIHFASTWPDLLLTGGASSTQGKKIAGSVSAHVVSGRGDICTSLASPLMLVTGLGSERQAYEEASGCAPPGATTPLSTLGAFGVTVPGAILVTQAPACFRAYADENMWGSLS